MIQPHNLEFEAYLQLQREHPDLFVNVEGGVIILTDLLDIEQAVADMGTYYVSRGMPADWAHVGVMYQDPYLIVLRDAVRFPDGNTGIHHRTIRLGSDPTGVVILPFFRSRILLLKHFRHPTRQWHWEFPRGAVEPNQSLEETVRTELREEIQGEASRVAALGYMYGASGFMGLRVAMFAAWISEFGAPALGEGIVATRLVSVSEFETMINDGEITDSFTLCTWLRAKLAGLT